MVGLAGRSPAPIYDPPPNFKPTPERSQEQVAEEQRFQKVQGTVGGVELDTTPATGSYERDSSQAASEIAASASSATQDMEQATEDAARPEASAGRSWGLGLFMLILGLATFAGFRQWANKAVPMPRKFG